MAPADYMVALAGHRIPPSSNLNVRSVQQQAVLVFRADPGRGDMILKAASADEAASKRRVPPPAFGPVLSPLSRSN
jgi:hypothetical protein